MIFTKGCGRQSFLQTLNEYELQNGVAGLKSRGASANDISSIITEFEAVVGTRMNCLSGEENIESLKGCL